MISMRARFTRTVLTLGGLAAATTVLVSGTAAADSVDVMDAVFNADCNYNQVDLAMQGDPVAAVLRDQLPQEKKDELKAIMDTPLSDRQEKINAHRQQIEEKVRTDPEAAALINDPKMDQVREMFGRVAQNCAAQPK
ncbi:hypothetical protein DFR76_114133 [Nocardia pseudobrasiliensis]|uniref:Hemophore-related protein n=2 Tax=Nocardia pseudobrasiliensis TaxID=45979 RepID=A0A370HSB8_9NOCA|nr:hypothetical protein DFR76_114133 [Nocardia pseudobrasiliensis]